MLNYVIYIFKKILHKFKRENIDTGVYSYRYYLFQELIGIYSKEHFANKRILEIGPKEGEDTKRLSGLNPKDYVMFDLPDKSIENEGWIGNLNENQKLIIKNFLYLTPEEYEDLGMFDLIYFTGVLYHNPEQLRFIKKLYDKLNIGGVLVLESATVRNFLLRKMNLVQVWYPNTYRNTTTISHLPSKEAIKSWLKMVGFSKIYDSKCYNFENYNVKDSRYACIAEKQSDDKPQVYYKKQIENSDFEIGGST